MNRTAEVDCRRSQVGEYLSEDVIGSKLEIGNSKREFGFWCVSYVGGTLFGIKTKTRTQNELN